MLCQLLLPSGGQTILILSITCWSSKVHLKYIFSIVVTFRRSDINNIDPLNHMDHILSVVSHLVYADLHTLQINVFKVFFK